MSHIQASIQMNQEINQVVGLVKTHDKGNIYKGTLGSEVISSAGEFSVKVAIHLFGAKNEEKEIKV